MVFQSKWLFFGHHLCGLINMLMTGNGAASADITGEKDRFQINPEWRY